MKYALKFLLLYIASLYSPVLTQANISSVADENVSVIEQVTKKGTSFASTISFNLQLCDGSKPEGTEYPVPEGGTVTLTDSEDASITFTATTVEYGAGSTNVFVLAQFTDVPYGTYDVVATAPGFQDKETTYVVNADSNIPPNDKIYLDPIASSIDTDKFGAVAFFPNPTKGELNISGTSAIVNVEIYSVHGAKQKQLAGDNISQINISELPKGLYLITTTDVNGQRQITKINKH